MKTLRLIAILASSGLISGCAQLGRPIADAALAAGGALVGHKLSDGNPLATAAGAVAGVGISESVYALKTKGERKALEQGFTKGRSDGIKEIYWNLQEEQRNRPAIPQIFEVNVSGRQTGGILLNETKKHIGQ